MKRAHRSHRPASLSHEAAPSAAASTRRQLLICLLLLFIFCSGLVAGMSLGRYRTIQAIRARVDRALAGDRDIVAQMVMRRLDRALDLDQAQHEAIAPIVSNAVTKVGRLRSRILPDYLALLDQTADAIAIHLDPSQQTRLRRLRQTIAGGLRPSSFPAEDGGPDRESAHHQN